MEDAIIIGGGPAGLQAALTLGRMHRRTVLFDSGEYRNARVLHAQNALTLDGLAPAEIRRRAHAELDRYADVTRRDERVATLLPTASGFAATTAGGERVEARTVILATGVTDTLPSIPGLAEAWGDRVAHCPFCHGHEFAGQSVAIIGTAPHTEMQGAMLRPIVSQVTAIAPDTVRAVEATDSGLRVIGTDGTERAFAGVFIATETHPRSPFAADLGLTLQESGAIAIDAFGRTSLDGVYAAGDNAHSDAYPRALWTIASAIAAGQLAATAIVQRFVADELT